MPDATPYQTPDRRSGAHPAGMLRLLLTILLTYPRRPWLWSWPLGTALLTGFVASHISPMYDARSTGLENSDPLPYEGCLTSAFLLALSVGFMVASITGHFLQVLTPPRGHVVPRLRPAALAALIFSTILIALAAVALWPHPKLTLAGPGYVQPHAVSIALHAAAFMLVIAGQFAWTQFAPVTGTVTIFAWGTLAFAAVRDALVRMLIGQAPQLEFMMVAVGVALFLTLWLAIARRRDRSYQLDPIYEALTRKFHGTTPPTAAVARPASGGMIPTTAAPRRTGATARLRLHRQAASGGTSAALAGLTVGLFFAGWILIAHLYFTGAPDPMMPRILCMMVSIIPAILVTVTAMDGRGPLIAQGLLLPQPRPQFVRELGLAMLTNLFTAWIGALVPLLAITVFLLPAYSRPAPAALGAMVVVAAAYQIFAFGTIACILRLTHRLAITFAMTGVCCLGIVTLIGAGAAPRIPSALATTIVAAVLAVVGACFAIGAYHQWAHREPPPAGPSKTAAAL